MRGYTFVVGAAEAGTRLDQYLSRHLPSSLSRAMIQRAIETGRVALKDRPAKAGARVRRGDVVAARFDELPPAPRTLAMTPQHIPLDIAYEDDEVLVVNKPAGLVTHPAPGHWDGTLVNALLWHLQSARQLVSSSARQPSTADELIADEPLLERAGIVHRLDKETSGLLLVAKTERAHASLSKQMKARTISRRYLAVVEGHLPLDEGTIHAAIGRHLRHRKEMTVRHLGGREAVTHYRVLSRGATERLETGDRGQETGMGDSLSLVSCLPSQRLRYTVVEVSLQTGRTHQIRVHLSHLGHPVLGDTTYGKRPASFWHALGIPRQLLHAYRLQFTHPASGKPITLTAPLPEDFPFFSL